MNPYNLLPPQTHEVIEKHQPSDLIVYLDYHSKVSDGGCDLIFDFRLNKDFRNFVSQFVEIKKEGVPGSYIHIIGYSTNKRLMRGCYYQLNVQLLKRAKFRPIIDSYLFLAEFEFTEGTLTEDDDELLQSHQQLEPSEMLWNGLQKGIAPNNQVRLTDLQLHVADVGQANWNELRWNGNTIVQYDMGADIHASRQQVDSIYKSHAPAVEPQTKALLVISHWDMDHIHCLCSMSVKNIQDTFCMVWCPDAIKSETARRILEKLNIALTAANVHCIAPHSHTPRSEYHMHHLQQLNSHIRLYIGENRRNINHSGIVMFVEDNTTSANYTGDCLLCQADEALQDALTNGLNLTEHILIAPHHGGANQPSNMRYTLNHPVSKTQVIISVGNGNSYGHPDAKMLAYLQSLANGRVKQTNKHGDITIDI